jgi:hypothetical protein
MAALSILAAWTVLGYALELVTDSGPDHEWWRAWREYVLIALLPALGVIHLLYLATRSASEKLPT